MKIKEINADGATIHFAPCTAVAASIGDTERQTATYFAARLSSGELYEEIIFGVAAESTSAAIEQIDVAKWERRSTDSADLDTVAFADGTTPRDYCFN